MELGNFAVIFKQIEFRSQTSAIVTSNSGFPILKKQERTLV
jgi:hypothetical protein